MSRLGKLRGLSWADRRLLMQAAAFVAFAKFALPLIAFRADARKADEAGAGALPESNLVRAQSIARLAGIACAYIPVRVTCLHRSLALWWLLRRYGICCNLRLGARTAGGPFSSHAWVQCEAVALNERRAHISRYCPFGEAILPTRRRLWQFVAQRVS